MSIRSTGIVLGVLFACMLSLGCANSVEISHSAKPPRENAGSPETPIRARAISANPLDVVEHSPPKVYRLDKRARQEMIGRRKALQSEFQQPRLWIERFGFKPATDLIVRASWVGDVVSNDRTFHLSRWAVKDALFGSAPTEILIRQPADGGVVPLHSGVLPGVGPVVLLIRYAQGGYQVLEDGMGTIGALYIDTDGRYQIQNGPRIDLTLLLAEARL